MMRIRLQFYIPAVILSLLLINGALRAAAPREVDSFDADWRFQLQDEPAAQKPELDDSAWRQLDVPHDWSIELPAAADNPTGGAGGFFASGVGWYRKHFSLDEKDFGKRIFIHFDSVMSNSDVWINGHPLGHRPYGYVPLHDELTGYLNFGAGKTNVLAVRVDQSKQPASRYYTGAGIIGHVRLLIVNPVHFQHDSLYVTTPKITVDQAVVHVQATIDNQSDAPRNVSVRIDLIGPDGKNTASKTESTSMVVAAGKSVDISQDISVASPMLWDLDHPQMYRAQVTLLDGNDELDDDSTSLGIRSIKFDATTGFSLNGKSIRIQGVCLHADASCLGTAVPIAAWEHRLSALKPFGVNALRTAHNPPTPQFLDLCDRMGFLVMDEMFDCWDVAKTPFDYHLYFDKWSLIDLRDAVRRDRNHPSIILYSAGNEIHDTPNAAESIRILTGLVKEFHANDLTRPVTQALLRPNVSHDYTNGLADLLDVIGTNYRMKELTAAQKAKPGRLIIGTENHISDIPFLADHPQLAGIFIWAGADYLGEAKSWPQFADGSGLLDRTNQPRASAYFARAAWSAVPFVHVARGASRVGAIPLYAPGSAGDELLPGVTTDPAETLSPAPGTHRRRNSGTPTVGPGPTADWTPAHLEPHPEIVWVYSNSPKVVLTLNGKVIKPNADPTIPNGTHTFSVQFAPGILKAVALGPSGNPVATDVLHTAGAAAKLILTSDSTNIPNDFDDIVYVRAAVTDANGITVPTGSHEITFTTTGPGAVVATDSADNRYHEPFQSTQRLSFGGKCDAVVKSKADSGSIEVMASSPGLSSATITLQAVPATAGSH